MAGAMGNGNQLSSEPTFSPEPIFSLDFGLASTLALKLQALTFPSTLWGWTCLSKPLPPQSLPPSLYPPECRATPTPTPCSSESVPKEMRQPGPGEHQDLCDLLGTRPSSCPANPRQEEALESPPGDPVPELSTAFLLGPWCWGSDRPSQGIGSKEHHSLTQSPIPRQLWPQSMGLAQAGQKLSGEMRCPLIRPNPQ